MWHWQRRVDKYLKLILGQNNSVIILQYCQNYNYNMNVTSVYNQSILVIGYWIYLTGNHFDLYNRLSQEHFENFKGYCCGLEYSR